MALPASANPAALMIGPLQGRERIVQDFYTGCPFEPAVAAWATVESQATYSTLDGLFDLLIAAERSQIILVNHGSLEPAPGYSAAQGLLIPFARGATARATGPIIGTLAQLAGRAASLAEDDWAVHDAALRMTVSNKTALGLIKKLAEVRQKQRIIHLRGCHVGEDRALCGEYKSALNAVLFTAPRCRMFYMRVTPARNSGARLRELSHQQPRQPNTRRRSFPWPGDPSRLLVLDVRDIDGHSHVTPSGYIEHQTEAGLFASLLLKQWTGHDPTEFCFEALWSNSETSYIVPQDTQYSTHMTIV